MLLTKARTPAELHSWRAICCQERQLTPLHSTLLLRENIGHLHATLKREYKEMPYNESGHWSILFTLTGSSSPGAQLADFHVTCYLKLLI